jgi:hypothetical protein
VTVAELSWLQTGLLLLTPAFVLAAALVLGRYPGEKLLARPRRTARRRRRPVRFGVRWLTPLRRVGGGLLLGHSLAGRAPPSFASSHL